MHKKIEMEYKFLVDKKIFYFFLERFSNEYQVMESYTQINYYYDTNGNLLNKQNITMRIRQQDNKLKWQLKKHQDLHGAICQSDECEGHLSSLPSKISIKGINTELYLKGNLVTERTILFFGNSGKLCFDINMYLGIVDYEIEIEFDHCDQQRADIIANTIGLNTNLIFSKNTRFFKCLEDYKREEKLFSIY